MDALSQTAIDDDAFTRLEALDALGAVRAWLEDDYDWGEDRVLMQAIRRDTGITLGDHAMWTVLSRAYALDASPARTLANLVALDATTPEGPET